MNEGIRLVTFSADSFLMRIEALQKGRGGSISTGLHL